MPPQTEEQLVAKLAEVFRRHGFEATTLAMISEATGLKRSSLYHRFPDGKEQMAKAVLESVGEQLVGHVLAPLAGDEPPARRVKQMAKRLTAFYGGGTKSCFLDTFSLGTNDTNSANVTNSANDTNSANNTNKLSEHLRSAYAVIHAAFTQVSIDAGKRRPDAKSSATMALVQIEGALVVARVSGDVLAFKKVISRLPSLLCDPS